ncbi:MAG TPA: type IVB secretion system protein IcmV [Gammaproteobacteria bacterium]|nr:type IVB secretion system protein IcmV [Gammaproteobacteria bacterium]
MKKLFTGLGRAFFPFRNPKRMVGWDQLKDSFNSFVRDPAKEVWDRKQKRVVIKETFEEALVRLNLSEEMVVERRKTFLRTALFFVGVALVLFVYTMYLLFSGLFLATFIGCVLVVIALALAFRDHFWYTQMKHRRLGLSFSDWANYTLGRIKK